MVDAYEGIEGIRQSHEPQSGDVHLVFHTYSYMGSLVCFLQTRHDVVLPADQARTLLKRLLDQTMTWRFVIFGGVIVPIITLLEYRAQARKISIAVRRGFPVIFD